MMHASDRRGAMTFAAGLLLGAALLSPALAGEAASEPAPEAATHGEPAQHGEAAKVAKAAAPAEGALAPYLAVRSLQALQDQVARGSGAAQAAQPRMLTHVADVFADADPAVWKEPRNAGAAALYLFSAGRPAVVRAVLERGAAVTPDGDRLLKGALAYAEGEDDVARSLLGTFDPKALPPSLGGHLALVLATLFADKDHLRADAMLDAARLLVPGTLVEEAALRRQIFLLADPASLGKFATLSRQYLRRFRNSAFAANFKGRLVSFAARLAVTGDVAQLAKLDPVLTELPATERRGVYLTLSRDALVAARPEAARYAAARAAALAPDPAEAERAKLYTVAATAASDAAPAARSALGAIDGSRLSGRDAELREAAVAVASSVDLGLGDSGAEIGRGGPAPDTPTAALIERAHRAMADGDAILAVDTAALTGPGARRGRTNP